MASRALVIGRFQPPHIGHIELIRVASWENSRVIVAIGSAQDSHTPRNPFTAGERYEMLQAALAEEGIHNVDIIPVTDVNRNAIWVAHLESMLPLFNTVYANNPLVRQLFEEEGYTVRTVQPFKREAVSATAIRSSMGAGLSDWEKLVPPAVARIVGEINGMERMRQINSTD